MTDRIKNNTYEIPPPGATIKSLDKQKTYPVDLIKELYIHSDKGLSEWARDLGVSADYLERVARTGAKNWHDAKKEIQLKRVEGFREVSTDILVERQSLAQKLEIFTLMEIRFRLQEIQEHFEKYGHFYMVAEDGQIVKDGKGQNMRLSLPNSQRDLLSLRAIEDLRLSNQTLLNARIQEDAESAATTLDIKSNPVKGLFEAEDE